MHTLICNRSGHFFDRLQFLTYFVFNRHVKETEAESGEEFEPEGDTDPENESDESDAERIPSLPSVRAELRSGVSSTTQNMACLVFLLSFCALMV